MSTRTQADPILVRRLGLVPYLEGLSLQERLRDARRDGGDDVLLLLEHPPVFTKGRRSEPEELGMGEDWYRMQGIEVHATDRGGRVTYHGPGQLVGYPILDLGGWGDDVGAYVRRLERVMIGALARLGLTAGVIEGLTGVWTEGSSPVPPGSDGPQGTPVGTATADGGPPARKIGSIGVHLSRGITTHGFAVNVCNDLQPFNWVVPCGIESAQVTSVSRELGRRVEVGELEDAVIEEFGAAFERELRAGERQTEGP